MCVCVCACALGGGGTSSCIHQNVIMKEYFLPIFVAFVEKSTVVMNYVFDFEYINPHLKYSRNKALMRHECLPTYYAAGAWDESSFRPFGPFTLHLSMHWWTPGGRQPDVPPAGSSWPQFWFPIIGNIVNYKWLQSLLSESCSGASFPTQGRSKSLNASEPGSDFSHLILFLSHVEKTPLIADIYRTSFYWLLSLWDLTCDLIIIFWSKHSSPWQFCALDRTAS